MTNVSRTAVATPTGGVTSHVLTYHTCTLTFFVGWFYHEAVLLDTTRQGGADGELLLSIRSSLLLAIGPVSP